MRDFLLLARRNTVVQRTLRALGKPPPDIAGVRKLLASALDGHETAEVRQRARRKLIEYARASDEIGWLAISTLTKAANVMPRSRMAEELSNTAWKIQLTSLTRIRARALKAASDKMIELGVKSKAEVVAMLTDTTQPVSTRTAAAEILGNLGGRLPVGPIINVIREPIPNLVWATAHVIGEIRSRSFTRPLISVVRQSEFGASRQAAISALGDLNDARAVPLLKQIVRNALESDDTRSLAANALSLMARKCDARKALIALTRDTSPLLRYSAVCALSPWVADRGAREALEARLGDSDPIPAHESVAELVTSLLQGSVAGRSRVPPS